MLRCLFFWKMVVRVLVARVMVARMILDLLPILLDFFFHSSHRLFHTSFSFCEFNFSHRDVPRLRNFSMAWTVFRLSVDVWTQSFQSFRSCNSVHRNVPRSQKLLMSLTVSRISIGVWTFGSIFLQILSKSVNLYITDCSKASPAALTGSDLRCQWHQPHCS